MWEADQELPSPDYNAESYAGAATGMCIFILICQIEKGWGFGVSSLLLLTKAPVIENYFMKLCKFTSIGK